METGWRRERATTRVAPTTGLPEPIFRGMTMALRRPHKGLETGWRRERATTRVAPTTGLPEPILSPWPCEDHIRGWKRVGAENGQPQGLPLQQVCRSLFSEESPWPCEDHIRGWKRARATTRVAPTTAGLWRRPLETGWRREQLPLSLFSN